MRALTFLGQQVEGSITAVKKKGTEDVEEALAPHLDPARRTSARRFDTSFARGGAGGVPTLLRNEAITAFTNALKRLFMRSVERLSTSTVRTAAWSTCVTRASHCPSPRHSRRVHGNDQVSKRDARSDSVWYGAGRQQGRRARVPSGDRSNVRQVAVRPGSRPTHGAREATRRRDRLPRLVPPSGRHVGTARKRR